MTPRTTPSDGRLLTDDRISLNGGGAKLSVRLALGGMLILAGSLAASLGHYRRFLFAYLVAFCFVLSLALGSLIFVLLQHLTRAGWSVTVRRPAEAIAATLPVLGLLSLPILASVASQKGDLYRWALPVPAHHAVAQEVKVAADAERVTPHAALDEAAERPHLDPLTLKKRAWLNPAFFVGRVVAYFAVWSLIARWFARQSAGQDRTADPRLTERMQALAPVCLIATAVTMTLAAFDLIMSLDPHWYSTIFGVYYFAGSFVGTFATLILVAMGLQRAGLLRNSITPEHYHDLGKWLFAFVFFWGYIAFSQYMLLWYANIPEETTWLARHGATTVTADVTRWSLLAVALLFGHLLFPFGGLLSRHVKRDNKSLAFWAAWLLVFHFVDLYWVIVPEFGRELRFLWVDAAALVGIGAVFAGATLHRLRRHELRPTADPRLGEALAFTNH